MRDRPRSLMIFAAGRGTRMAPLTDDRPKPLLKVGGLALIDHALGLAGGFDRVVVNTHYLSGMLETHLTGRDVILSHETDLLETGGGLRKALPLLGDGPVATLNSDAVWRGDNVLSTLIAAWDPTRMEALVAVIPQAGAVGHKGKGDFCLDAEGRVSRGPGYIYTGAQITKTERIAEIGEHVFSLNKVWDALIAEGTLYGVPYAGQWCDVGQPESIPLAEALLDV